MDLNSAPPPFRAAAIQFEPVMFEHERNVSRLLALTEEAAQKGARLIVHPEMANTGYCWANRAEVAPFVETIPGPTTARVQAICAKHDCYVVMGMAELVPETGIYYNSSPLIGPNGVVGNYRKTHSFISEPKWAKDGDLGIPVFETELGRIAVTICMDAVYPETARVPALLGADVICFPTNWIVERSPSATWIARAFDSGTYFIAANRYGLERGVQFSGGSCVINPDATVQSYLDTGDGIVYGEIDPSRARDKQWDRGLDKLADRRPELYGDITLSTYRWQNEDFHGLYDLSPLPTGAKSEVVVAQFTPIAGDIDANLAQIEQIASKHAGAGLIVFPELALTGPVDGIIASSVAKSIESSAMTSGRRIAREFKTTLCVGFAECDGERFFNSAVLISGEGVVGVYRKTHLSSVDRSWATPGDQLKWFDLPVGRTGILIGYDALFPEATTCLALNGCDLIAVPSALSGPAVQPIGPTALPVPRKTGDSCHWHIFRERARETNTLIAFANQAAPAMGWSGIFGPSVEQNWQDQAVLEGDSEGSVSHTLDTTNLDTRYKTNQVRAKDVVAMRVPIWYDILQTPLDRLPTSTSARSLVAQAGDD